MLFCHGVQRCRLPVLREIRQPLGTSIEAPSFLWTGDYYALTIKVKGFLGKIEEYCAAKEAWWMEDAMANCCRETDKENVLSRKYKW